MPSFVVAALITAGVSTGIGVALAIPAVMANVGMYFLTSFATATVLGGLSNTLPKRPSDE